MDDVVGGRRASLRIGLAVAQQRLSFAELSAPARFAEELGFDGILGMDHFQPMDGQGPGECFEGLTTLAALSGVTTKLRLGLLVAGVTYRPVGLLAAEAITIDHASNGRLELSLGAAWFQPEHAALGFRFMRAPDRVTMLDEALHVLRGLLTQDGFTYEGRYCSVREATLLPRPVQLPHPPIWVGAARPRMLRIAARHADVWHVNGNLPEIGESSRRVSEFAEREGRDPRSIVRAASCFVLPHLDDTRHAIDALRDAGFGYVVVAWPIEGRALLEEFGELLLPEITAA